MIVNGKQNQTSHICYLRHSSLAWLFLDTEVPQGHSSISLSSFQQWRVPNRTHLSQHFPHGFTKSTQIVVRWAFSTKAARAHQLNAQLCISGSDLRVEGRVPQKENNKCKIGDTLFCVHFRHSHFKNNLCFIFFLIIE